jgi:type I restriction enzyme M protein
MPHKNPQTEGFDVVMVNPPWGVRVDPAGLNHFPLPTSDATGLFIQHALQQLRPNGRAVIVVPQGFLSRSGIEKKLRQMILEQNTLKAVVSLPVNAFEPYTSVQLSILVIRSGGSTDNVRMINAEDYFDKRTGNWLLNISPVIGAAVGAIAGGPIGAPAGYFLGKWINKIWSVSSSSLISKDGMPIDTNFPN